MRSSRKCSWPSPAAARQCPFLWMEVVMDRSPRSTEFWKSRVAEAVSLFKGLLTDPDVREAFGQTVTAMHRIMQDADGDDLLLANEAVELYAEPRDRLS